MVGAKLQQDTQTWLSPPDPWKNHNIACGSRHPGTAAWFVQGDMFSEWKSSVLNSLLLWVHRKRQLPPSSCTFVEADHLPLCSGRREKCVLVCVIFIFFTWELTVSVSFTIREFDAMWKSSLVSLAFFLL